MIYISYPNSLCLDFGVEENDIGHNMRCIVLDPDRRMIKTYDGLDWLPKDAKADLEKLMMLKSAD